MKCTLIYCPEGASELSANTSCFPFFPETKQCWRDEQARWLCCIYPRLASSVNDAERQAGWYHTRLMQASYLAHTSRYECLTRIGAGWSVNFISNTSHLSLLLVNSTTCGISKIIKIFSWVDPFSIGWCSGYHGWRDRGRYYQVFGPSLFGRIQPAWQGSLCKRNKQVSKPVQWRLMTPHCWFPCCDSSFAAGLGTFWCLRKTTVCWRNGLNQFWNRCCWSRTLKWGWVLGFLFGFPLVLLYVLKAKYGSRYVSSAIAPKFFKFLFLEQKPGEKYTFVFHLLGSSLDSIKGDPPIRQRDQPPWICLLLGLQSESCTHPSGLAMTQMYMKRKWLNSCINYSD